MNLNTDKLINGEQLLEALFEPQARPTLRWLAHMKAKRVIPFYKIGRRCYFDLEKVRRKLQTKNEVRSV